MSKNLLNSAIASILLASGICHADVHSQQAAEHAKAAADAAGDSQAIGEHAQEALRHLDAAKVAAARAGNPAAAKHLRQGEMELQNAIKDAARFNSGTAAQSAKDAKTHLDQIAPK